MKTTSKTLARQKTKAIEDLAGTPAQWKTGRKQAETPLQQPDFDGEERCPAISRSAIKPSPEDLADTVLAENSTLEMEISYMLDFVVYDIR